MRFSLSLAAAGLASVAQAQFLVSDLSFGHTGRLEVGRPIPNFATTGTPENPQVLSNKVILTPPAPGNARGSIWASNPNKYATWVADVDFRVGGPERGGGNLNIWLARGGSQDIGQSSIYTINKFDGLALVLDQHSGSGGMIRGFLNDGTIDFKTQPNIDSLAFGHCNYAYRNLGRPSQIKFRQTQDNFRVDIDGHLCFESNKIRIPPGYSFGITAASADLPDSHEVFKMVVMTENLSATVEGSPPMRRAPDSNTGNQNTQNNNNNNNNNNNQNWNNNNGDPNEVPDVDAAKFTTSESQFRDIHGRLQGINHQLGSIFRQISSINNMGSNRHEEMQGVLKEVQAVLGRLNRLDALESKFDSMTRDMTDLRRDLKNKIHDSEMAVKSAMGGQHGSMLEHVANQTTPRHGKLIFVIVGSQFLVVAAYIYYERKKLSPKKYL